jgi:hypothetical protein
VGLGRMVRHVHVDVLIDAARRDEARLEFGRIEA